MSKIHKEHLQLKSTRRQITSFLNGHFILTRIIIIKKRQTLRSVGEDVEKLEPSYIPGKNVNGVGVLENSPSKMLNNELSYDPVIPFLFIYVQEN